MPVPVPKSVLYFTKEASEYQCEESDEGVQEAEGEEEDSDKKKPEEGPEKDLDPAEDSPREPSFSSSWDNQKKSKLVMMRLLFTAELVIQFSSVAQSCPTLCDPMNRSTPGLPVHHRIGYIYGPGCDLSWRMFHVHLRKSCQA